MKVGLVSPVSFRSTEKPTVSVVGVVPTNLLEGIQDKVDTKSSNADIYKARLKDPEWEKKYIPEAQIVHMKQKNMIDGLEYEITPSGKVTEVGCWKKPTVILEDDEDSKKMFTRNGLISQDKFNVVAEQPEKKKTTFREKIANVWKFFSAADKMIGATIKGIIYGTLTGTVLTAGAWVFKALPKAFTKEGPKFMEIVKQPLKHIGKSGKIIAGIGAAAVMAYHLISGKLQTNQRTAVIDHKMKTGHRDV